MKKPAPPRDPKDERDLAEDRDIVPDRVGRSVTRRMLRTSRQPVGGSRLDRGPFKPTRGLRAGRRLW